LGDPKTPGPPAASPLLHGRRGAVWFRVPTLGRGFASHLFERAMSQAIVDPEQLRRFAHNLKRFNSELQSQMQTLHGQLKQLGETWRDKEQQKFNDEFEQTVQSIAKFVEAAEEHVPFLLRKADRVEEYLRQR
jgi:WXG100 family type VII secretion target